MESAKIQNVLLDLGGVLYAIDIDEMLRNFNAMIEPGYDKVSFSMEGQHEMFSLLDIGRIDVETFASGLKEAYHLQGNTEEIIHNWNSLLKGVIPGRIKAVERMAQKYRVALLSNTNYFHFQSYAEETRPLFAPMEHLYLSFEMGLRKPNDDIYEAVLAHSGWQAEETVFVDDGLANTQAAAALGFQTVHFQNENDFDSLMNRLGV